MSYRFALPMRSEDRVELLVADLSLARAFYAGVPAARLLARMRLDMDQRDVDEPRAKGKPGVSTWDAMLAAVLPEADAALDRVRKAVARHTRAASDEGPLAANEAAIAALVHAVAFSPDIDASPAESYQLEVPRQVAAAAAAFDKRLAAAKIDRRALLFEGCVRLATLATAGPWLCEKLIEAARVLHAELSVALLRPAVTPVYPRVEPEINEADARMILLERTELDAFVARDPREVASAIAWLERTKKQGVQLDQLIGHLGKLLKRSGSLVLAVIPPDDAPSLRIPSLPPSSWMPSDWTSPEAINGVIDAIERGMVTLPRLRGLILRGGDPALDAVGTEMLRVEDHPFASAAFADVLARSNRQRDVMRLVTYFAIAPDPKSAARSLSLCTSPELPGLLRNWLEAMLPSDGGPASSRGDPDTSSGARLAACVEALQPYARLFEAVQPLLARLSEIPRR